MWMDIVLHQLVQDLVHALIGWHVKKKCIPPKKDLLKDQPSVVLIIAKNCPSIDDIRSRYSKTC